MTLRLCSDSNRPNGRSIRLLAVTRNHRLKPVECSSGWSIERARPYSPCTSIPVHQPYKSGNRERRSLMAHPGSYLISWSARDWKFWHKEISGVRCQSQGMTTQPTTQPMPFSSVQNWRGSESKHILTPTPLVEPAIIIVAKPAKVIDARQNTILGAITLSKHHPWRCSVA